MAYHNPLDRHHYHNHHLHFAFLDEGARSNRDPSIQHHQDDSYRTMYQMQLHRAFDQSQLSSQLANDVSYPSYLQPPYYSPPSTLFDRSSVSSDRLSPSIGSSASTLLRTPELPSAELSEAFSRRPSPTYDYTYGLPITESCVAMQLVQKCADALPEEAGDDFGSYDAYEPQEVIPVSHEHYGIPYPSTHSHQIPTASTETIKVKTEPNIRQRRRPTTKTQTKPSNKITKNYHPPTRRHRKSPNQTETDHPEDEELLRTFPCPLAPYGCPSTFSAKNEWKRHAATQHFRLGFWRCDQCRSSNHPSSRPNDFNRKDLFVQHVRRMHSDKTKTSKDSKKVNNRKKSSSSSRSHTVEANLNEAAERCYMRVREAPERCCCVFCPETFEGDGGLEGRMEHVGRHMESQGREGLGPVDVKEWEMDLELEAWMVRNGIVVRKNKRGGLAVPQRQE